MPRQPQNPPPSLHACLRQLARWMVNSDKRLDALETIVAQALAKLDDHDVRIEERRYELVRLLADVKAIKGQW